MNGTGLERVPMFYKHRWKRQYGARMEVKSSTKLEQSGKGAEWKKEHFAIAALTAVGRFRVISMDERVLYDDD